MGCLNSGQGFDHWFGNIHLSGPCNRSCYFCIGQWMPGQDMNNNLDTFPLRGIEKFVEECRARDITEVNITGSNTDPLLHKELMGIVKDLNRYGFKRIGIRTNGVLWEPLRRVAPLIDKMSISITSFDTHLYKETMGQGEPPDIAKIVKLCKYADTDLKLNVVLCPETAFSDIWVTIPKARALGVRRMNLREPYGQKHIGDPIAAEGIKPFKMVYGNPCYRFDAPDGGAPIEVTYWDVHYTEVESVNLYADGHVSIEYPISLGHSEELGRVFDQSKFSQGRQAPQWCGTKQDTRRQNPPKKTTTYRTCPACGDRSTKLLNLNTGLYTCQGCDWKYEFPPEQTAAA